MIVWLRTFVILIFIMTIVYVILWVRAQLKVRTRAKAEYIETDKSLSESDYVAKELSEYNKSFRPKLLLGIYILPLTLMGFLLYLANT